MPSAATIRLQIESALTQRIPSALTPAPRIVRETAATGIPALDELLHGGLPVGAITEIVGPECSGRTSIALAFVAQRTQEANICAWIDVFDNLHPESAVAAGVDLTRMLWVRCGVSAQLPRHASAGSGFLLDRKYLAPPAVKKGLHGGGCGLHPRQETKGLPEAVSGLLTPSCAETQPRVQLERTTLAPLRMPAYVARSKDAAGKPWSRLDQALLVSDLLLQSGGFSAVVLDMGSVAPEHALRVPMASWFRYRAAAERSRTSILLLSQHACAKSSASLLLGLDSSKPIAEASRVFTGMEYRVAVTRVRFDPTATNVVPLRKPPQSERMANWQSRAVWAGRR